MTRTGRNGLGIAGLIVAVSGVTWAVFTWFRPSPSAAQRGAAPPCFVFVADETGTPVRVVLLGPTPGGIPTDPRGIALVPAAWLGCRVSVRDPDNWTEIAEVHLVDTDDMPIRIVVQK